MSHSPRVVRLQPLDSVAELANNGGVLTRRQKQLKQKQRDERVRKVQMHERRQSKIDERVEIAQRFPLLHQTKLARRKKTRVQCSSECRAESPAKKNSFRDFVVKERGRQKKVFNQPLQTISQIHGYLSDKNIRGLLRQTNYNRRELFVMYSRFKALCAMSPSPEGIDRLTFKRGVARLSVEDDLFVNRVYDLIDEDQSDSVEWDEFLTVMSALEKGSRSSQILFFFRIYDIDGDGFIGTGDLRQMFLASSMLNQDQVTEDLVDAFVEKVFKLVVGDEKRQSMSLAEISAYLNGPGQSENVWDLFGRSMLRDFKEV